MWIYTVQLKRVGRIVKLFFPIKGKMSFVNLYLYKHPQRIGSHQFSTNFHHKLSAIISALNSPFLFYLVTYLFWLCQKRSVYLYSWWYLSICLWNMPTLLLIPSWPGRPNVSSHSLSAEVSVGKSLKLSKQIYFCLYIQYKISVCLYW